MNRETWLSEAVSRLRELFGGLDKQPPDSLRVSVGWSKKAGKGIGWCFPAAATEDGSAQIFISPELDESAPSVILSTLLHEMVHAADDCQSKHRGWFKVGATHVGLAGKMTATVAGDDLEAKLGVMAEALGPFPNARINTGLGGGHTTQQKNRQLLIVCPDGCGYKLRGSNKVLELGMPNCPVCDVEMERQ